MDLLGLEGTSGCVQLGAAWTCTVPLSQDQPAHYSPSAHPRQQLLPALTLDPILPHQPAHLVLAHRESTGLQGLLYLLLSCSCFPLFSVTSSAACRSSSAELQGPGPGCLLQSTRLSGLGVSSALPFSTSVPNPNLKAPHIFPASNPTRPAPVSYTA